MIGFLIASIILVTTSFIDDRKNLSPFLRLFIQFVIAGIIIGSGIGINEIRSPLGLISLDLFNFELFWKTILIIADILAVLWIVWMINAMNWLDWVSWLTSSVTSITSAILAFSAYMFWQGDIALIFMVMSVICFTFFLFDLERPKILMGDSGSMFLWLALAVFTIIAGGKIATAMIVMAAPLFDVVWTIGRRLLNKKSPFKGDLKHLHHKLLKKIWSRRKTVLIYALVCALFWFISLPLETLGKTILIWVVFIFLIIVEVWSD